MVTDGTGHCGDHFVVYKNIKPLYCILKSNIVLKTNYTSQHKQTFIEKETRGRGLGREGIR